MYEEILFFLIDDVWSLTNNYYCDKPIQWKACQRESGPHRNTEKTFRIKENKRKKLNDCILPCRENTFSAAGK